MEATFVAHSQAIERAYRAAERSAGEDRQQGREAFSSWKQKGWFWSTEDYNSPGFQERYINNNFAPRAQAMYDVLHSLSGEDFFMNCTAQQDLLALDFAGGPACLAAGTAQYLRQERDLDSCTMKIFDPVPRWSTAIDYLNAQYRSIEFQLQQKADLFEMAASDDVGCANIITIGSALVDFLEKSRVTEFWESIARQVTSNGSQLIVFMFDRFEMDDWLVHLPHVRPRSLGGKQGGLFPYAVYISLQLPLPRAPRVFSMPAPTTPIATRRQGMPMTPDAVRRHTGTLAIGSSSVDCRMSHNGTSGPSSSSSTRGGDVWIAPTGKKFHRESCDKKGCKARAVSRSEALSKNLTPCLVCKP